MKTIDGLINGLAEDNPGFVSIYYNSRSVRNLGKRYRKEENGIVNQSVPITTGSL